MIVTTEYMDSHLCTVDTQLGGSGAVAGPLNGAKLILATDNFAPGKMTTTASFTQPTTTSFTPPVLTWSVAHRDGQGDIVTISTPPSIQMADGTAQNIFGYGVTDGSGVNLLFSEVFANPVELADALSFFNLLIPFAPDNPNGKNAVISQ